MNRYAAGARFERDVIAYLENRGWECVRSAGSHGITDIIANLGEPYHELLLIQCKRHGVLPPNDWNKLVEMAERWLALPILAQKGEAGIELWELTGPKVPHERNPPKRRYEIDPKVSEV